MSPKKPKSKPTAKPDRDGSHARADHGDRRGINALPSIEKSYDDPALVRRIRELLIVEFNPKIVAVKLGVPKSVIARHRAQLMANDESFKSDMDAYTESLKAISLAAFERSLEIADLEATTAKSSMARVAAAKILLDAPGALARAQNKVEVNLSGAVSIDDVHEIVKRGEPKQEDV